MRTLILLLAFATGCVTGPTMCELEISSNSEITYCVEPVGDEGSIEVISFPSRPEDFDAGVNANDPNEPFWFTGNVLSAGEDHYLAYMLNDFTVFSCVDAEAYDLGTANFVVGNDGSMLITDGYLPFGYNGGSLYMLCAGPGPNNDGDPDNDL